MGARAWGEEQAGTLVARAPPGEGEAPLPAGREREREGREEGNSESGFQELRMREPELGGRGQGGALPEQGESPGTVTGTVVRLRGLGTSWGAQNPLQRRRQRPRHLAVSPTLSPLGLGPLPMAPPDPSPYLISRLCPCPLAIPQAPFPTLPSLRTTSWRRSHQVPSVS